MLPRRFTAVLAAAMVGSGIAVAGVLPAQAASAQRVELHAALTGSQAHPRARGTATFESGDHGRQLHVHLRGVAGLAGRHLVVYVHGARAGTMTVTRAGFAHLDRHGAPACRAGQPVRVRTGSGTLVAAGTFRRDHHHGMPAQAGFSR
jgi:hypothetical protein